MTSLCLYSAGCRVYSNDWIFDLWDDVESIDAERITVWCQPSASSISQPRSFTGLIFLRLWCRTRQASQSLIEAIRTLTYLVRATAAQTSYKYNDMGAGAESVTGPTVLLVTIDKQVHWCIKVVSPRLERPYLIHTTCLHLSCSYSQPMCSRGFCGERSRSASTPLFWIIFPDPSLHLSWRVCSDFSENGRTVTFLQGAWSNFTTKMLDGHITEI